jgi:hypothetical protein
MGEPQAHCEERFFLLTRAKDSPLLHVHISKERLVKMFGLLCMYVCICSTYIQ